MKRAMCMSIVLGLAVLIALTGCTFPNAPVVNFSPEAGHGATSVTITVADMGEGWSYRLELEDGSSRLQARGTFVVTVYPPATLFVSAQKTDGSLSPKTQIEILLENDPPIGYDPFGPLANFLVPGQMYVVDCNYHEWSAGFEWSAPIRAGFLDPEGDPWKITNVECWYMLDGARIEDPVFTPPLSPGEIEYHVGTPQVPADGHSIDNAFIIWPAVARWVYDGNGVARPIKPLPGYSPPPCGEEAYQSTEMTGPYIAPGTIYHVDITVEDAYGDVTVLNVEKPLTGRADCD